VEKSVTEKVSTAPNKRNGGQGFIIGVTVKVVKLTVSGV